MLTSPPDIFDCLPDWRGLSVVVMGSHPALTADLAALPFAPDIRIACNGAVAHPHDLAMLFDLACPSQPWWRTVQSLRPETLILGVELHAATSLPCLATFNSRPVLCSTPTLTRGLLRGGATITGCAVQLALHAGTRPTLCGVRLDTPLHAHAAPRLAALLRIPPAT